MLVKVTILPSVLAVPEAADDLGGYLSNILCWQKVSRESGWLALRPSMAALTSLYDSGLFPTKENLNACFARAGVDCLRARDVLMVASDYFGRSPHLKVDLGIADIFVENTAHQPQLLDFERFPALGGAMGEVLTTLAFGQESNTGESNKFWVVATCTKIDRTCRSAKSSWPCTTRGVRHRI